MNSDKDIDTSFYDRWLRRQKRNPWFRFWLAVESWRIRRSDAKSEAES